MPAEEVSEPPQLNSLLNFDGYLHNYKTEICRRYKEYRISLDLIESVNRIFEKLKITLNFQSEGLDRFTSSYNEYGIHVQEDNSIYCLEWAPGADGLSLVGDFS